MELGTLVYDQIIFSGAFPVLFVCKNGASELFLVCCYKETGKADYFILTETSSENLVKMLSDKITLRDAFLVPGTKKYYITKSNSGPSVREVSIAEWSAVSNLDLPKSGEYLDNSENEFDELICYYS